MEEDQTWRTLLGKLIADPDERHRIANAIGVSPITLIRWTTNKSNPRADNLQLLPDALPYDREMLIDLITKEYPYILHMQPQEKDDFSDIPAPFYAQVLNMYTANSPQLRESAICDLLLQQILKHLDPHQLGMMAMLARCVKPRPGKRIRSLLHLAGRSTAPWKNQIEQLAQFLGAESLSGHALITGHPIVIRSRAEIDQIFPLHAFEGEESSVAYPILLADRAVGSLYISSTQKSYFTQRYLDLIQKYVDLLVVAFEPNDFYDLSTIELGIMPSRLQQISYISHFKERVTQHIIQATRQSKSLTPVQASTMVWQELEEELLQLSSS
jgi:transcriptional regulator with XRE-family HTH domain